MTRVVILNDASVARGGATGLAMTQARMLHDRGVEVIYAAGDCATGEELFPGRQIEVCHANGTALMKSGKLAAATRGLYNPEACNFVRDLIEREDTADTVYHIHSFSKTLTPAIFAALIPVAERVFIHGHDFFLACPNGGFMDYQSGLPCTRRPLSLDCLRTHCDKRSRAQKMWRVVRQVALHQALPRNIAWGGILMIHPGMRPFFEMAGYDPNLLHTVRNPARALCTQRIQAEQNKRFYFIGRVEAEKGIEDLIAAAKQAQVPLSVIGTGPLEEPLRQAHPDVIFHGWMDRNQIGETLKDARALVMPSRYPEPFGLVAAEGSLSGLPVILSQSALLGPEMAEKGLGLTCSPNDPAGFAQVLRQVAAQPALDIRAMSEAGVSGRGGLCTTPEAWIDAHLAHYARVTTVPPRPVST